MTMELIQARKLIKSYIKHMEDCPQKEYLMRLQNQLKAYVNNCDNLIISIHNVGDNWTIKNEISGLYTFAKVQYDILKEEYTIKFDRITSSWDAIEFFEVSVPSKLISLESEMNKLVHSQYLKSCYDRSSWKINLNE